MTRGGSGHREINELDDAELLSVAHGLRVAIRECMTDMQRFSQRAGAILDEIDRRKELIVRPGPRRRRRHTLENA